MRSNLSEYLDTRPSFDDSDTHLDASDSDSESSEPDVSRDHYVAVGKSDLRDKVELEQNRSAIEKLYPGKRVSRKALEENGNDYSDNSDFSAESTGHNSSRLDDSETEDDSADSQNDSLDSASDLDESIDQSLSIGSDNEIDSESSDILEASDQIDESDLESESESDIKEELKRSLTKEQKKPLKERSLNVTKGQNIRNQNILCDRLLTLRIYLQKVFSWSKSAKNMKDNDNDTFKSTCKTIQAGLVRLLQDLEQVNSALRQSLSDDNSIKKASSLGQLSSNTGEFDIKDVLSALDQQTAMSFETIEKTLSKWNSRTSNDFSLLESSEHSDATSRKKDFIEHLKEQTKLQILKEQNTKSNENDNDNDSDLAFYSALLRNLIDSRSVDVANDQSLKILQLDLQTRQNKKRKANVDVKASKGRKIRYQVHEKLENFMAPIPQGSWSEEQRTSLFHSLFGRKIVLDSEDDQNVNSEDEEDEEDENIPMELKLFNDRTIASK